MSAIQLALALLPFIQTAIPEFIAWIGALRAAAQQAGEWTPEQELYYRTQLLAKTGNPAYAPDPPAPGTTLLPKPPIT